MAVSDAHKKASMKWSRANAYKYWRATIVIPIGEKAAIMEAAAKRGLSLSEYVRALVKADMERIEEEEAADTIFNSQSDFIRAIDEIAPPIDRLGENQE